MKPSLGKIACAAAGAFLLAAAPNATFAAQGQGWRTITYAYEGADGKPVYGRRPHHMLTITDAYEGANGKPVYGRRLG